MSGSGSFVIASTTSTTQSLAFALRSRYTRRAGTRPSRSRAAGRSSKSIERSRSIAACTSVSISRDRLRRDRARELGERLQAHVDGAHHLDRIVMDVRRDPLTLRLLGVLQAAGKLASLLQGPAEHVEAPSKLLLGLLAFRDIQHHPAPIQERAVEPTDRRRLVADPDRPPVLGDDPILIDVPLCIAVGFLVRDRDPVAVLGMDRGPPQLRDPRSIPPRSTRAATRSGGWCRGSSTARRVDRCRGSPGHPPRASDRRPGAARRTAKPRPRSYPGRSTPASNAIRGTMLSRSSHSSRLCAPPPTGPRPSRVGQPAALVVLPSDAPPVAASESANPSSSATGTATSTNRWDARLFSIGRCPASDRTEIVTPSLTGVGTDRFDRSLRLLERRELGRTEIHLQDGLLGNHVRPGPTAEDADVARNAGPPPMDVGDLDRLVRGLDHRAPALVGFHPCMRGSAVDPDHVVGGPLPGGDDVAVGTTGFQDERRVVIRSESPDRRGRGWRADLLVGVAHVGDALEAVDVRVAEHVHSEEPRQEPSLHVAHARSIGALPVDRERSLGRRPVVEHGVHVADHQHPGSAGAPERSHEQVTELRLVAPGGAGRCVRRPSLPRGSAPRRGRRSC